ncbi:HesA/MoeB/ThiF family protein [Sulfurivermis fontis]|uniref:HesA/MoeB/ThiF family protein n=1 Tax=Sulfurivermis fontis TaxID=1972068 RepID=UPI000FDB037F|nr:molybdopterin-synthase adenylyltransferase MoeB [Sulfurivermis fontis]
MNDDQLQRYSRHITLPQVDAAGQRRLMGARVLIIGMGGLGSPIAIYLAAAGVGTLVLVDYDTVELSNLQRQVVHRTADVGRPKVESARDHLLELNPHIDVIAINGQLTDDALDEQVRLADVVVDASDNFETRFELNAACVRQRTPLVSGAAIRMEGQVTVFHNELPDAPCYRCLYRDEEGGGDTCALTGVLAPVVGIIGTVQATEVLKVLLGIGATLGGRLLLLDALSMEWRTLKLRKDPHCPVCGAADRR